MNKVNILDSVMGSGKTTYIFNEINRRVLSDDDGSARFLYVSPFLSEVGDPDKKHVKDRVGRIHRECSVADFKSPTASPTKATSLNRLLSQGENVCCTHKLFSDMSEETAELLESEGYEVIIDEAINVVQPFTKIKDGDMKYVKQSIRINSETLQVEWTALDDGASLFDYIKKLCHENRLYCYNGKFFIWELPPSILTRAKTVTICTYLFRSSVLHGYMRRHSIPFEYLNVSELGLASEESKIREATKLIEVVTNPYIEKLGKFSMTKTGYSNHKTVTLTKMKNMVSNMLQRHLDVKSSELIWTCFKDQQKKLSGRGYSRSWLSCSARATNDYGDRKVGIYLVDRYPNHTVNMFLQKSGAALDRDLFGLAEMLQWIWRLRIRNNQPIQLVIPSKRMRELLQRWLDGEFLLLNQSSSFAVEEAA